ncbi:MAG: hypothetical protein E6K78_10770 [Candidatus Eisenbacteria bacterium]|uniref:Uncharacterized protein n=1 Tax=Eiseniibacteriota bacterium TaxID=2212470 RepID=A0A538THZ5_UNCEI|nr:MAG: hypothetical protein E6K78_10770 [Candidatus Eisenbacteria bacterium]
MSKPSSPIRGPVPRERRRRRRGALDRLLTAPVSTGALEARGRHALAALLRPLRLILPAAALLALAYAGSAWWSRRAPRLAPRHRAEALCFALAQRPVFAPPMTVESGSALVRGRFSDRTPASVALREAMHFGDEMVMRERATRVGDFDVSQLWLRLPAGPGGGHWLVVAWMEGSSLAIDTFRFASDETDLSAGEIVWGDQLLKRLLVPENFRAASLPAVRLRIAPGGSPLTFGPKGTGG